MLQQIKNKLTERNEQGFTIIEVVLVLAIAGLIFLVVFLAVPQLQRSQRDSQRQSDLGRFMTSLENYSSNNNGRYPAADNDDIDDFVDDYITVGDTEFVDPSTGERYDLQAEESNADNVGDSDIPNDGATIYYFLGAQCGDDEATLDGGANRQIAVMVELENGVAFCQDNN